MSALVLALGMTSFLAACDQPPRRDRPSLYRDSGAGNHPHQERTGCRRHDSARRPNRPVRLPRKLDAKRPSGRVPGTRYLPCSRQRRPPSAERAGGVGFHWHGAVRRHGIERPAGSSQPSPGISNGRVPGQCFAGCLALGMCRGLRSRFVGQYRCTTAAGPGGLQPSRIPPAPPVSRATLGWLPRTRCLAGLERACSHVLELHGARRPHCGLAGARVSSNRHDLEAPPGQSRARRH
jgi:hypothetical protein